MKLCYVAWAAALAAAVYFAGPAAAQVKERTLKVGIGLNEDHPQGASVKRFGELVAQKSGGKLNVKLYPGGALGNDATMISALRGGTQEMTVPDSSTLVGLVKDFGVLNFPLLFNNEQEADALLDGPFGQKLLDEAAGEGPHRARLLGERLPAGHQCPAADQHRDRHLRPEDPRHPEPALHRHVQRARRQRAADAVPGALQRARAEDGRRPGEPDRHDPQQQVLRGPEVRRDVEAHLQRLGAAALEEDLGRARPRTTRRRSRRPPGRRPRSSARRSASTATRRSAS